jgi:DNA-binding MarR family transcriptional regulator
VVTESVNTQPVEDEIAREPRSGSDGVMDLAARLRTTVVPLARQLRQADARFTPTQLTVLGSIHRNGPLSLGDLSARERLSPPMISRVVASLEEEGVVERMFDASDRRVCLVRISEDGERWIRQTRADRDAWLAQRLAMLGPDELDALMAAAPVLEHLVDEDR